MITTLSIEGMSCEHCVSHVTKALEAISGVFSAQVNLQQKNAMVEHKDSVTKESLKAAVNEAGYEAL